MPTPRKAPRGGKRPQAPGPEPVRLTLEPRLDLGAADTLRETLLKARGRDVVMGGQGVEHLSAAGLQILIAARRSWAGEGRALSLEDPSERLLEGLARLGASIEVLTVEART